MKYFKLLVLLICPIFVQANELSKLIHLELKESENKSRSDLTSIKNKYFSNNIFSNDDVNNMVMFVDMEPDYNEKIHFKNEFIKSISGCKQELYIETSFVYHVGKNYYEVDRYNKDIFKKIDKCNLLDQSDRIYLASRVFEGSMAVKDFWADASYKAEVIARELRMSNSVISPKAASSIYFIISVGSIKACKAFGGTDCLAYKRYYPFLKMTQDRILYETNDYYLSRVFYPNQIAIVDEFDYLDASYFLD